MADVEVWGAEQSDGRVSTLTVRFKGAAPRTIDRDTALRWLAGGHSLILHSGAAHHPHRGRSLERVEVDGAAYVRADTQLVAADDVPVDARGATAGH